jgi:hypothetical protein
MLNSKNNNDITTNIFIKLFSDIFYIPKQNLITTDEWDKQMYSVFNIIEIYDITDQTFIPYYKYFMNTYVKNKNLPSFLSNLLINFFCSVQPFSYKIAICKNKNEKII